jgi:hypothetical protein
VDQTTQLLALIVSLAVVIIAIVLIRERQRRDRTAEIAVDSPYATSTEGEKRCPNCGMGNLWTDRNCISCNARLPG